MSAAENSGAVTEASVFLRDIPPGATEKDVREALQPFGEIASVSLPRQQGNVAEALQPKHFGFGTVWWNVMSHMWHDWLEAPSPLISTSSNTTPSILLSANPSQSRAESSTRIDTFFTVIRRNSAVALAFVGGAPFS